MPLTEKVSFTTMLQQEDKLQIPRLIRGRFKMENDQTLKIGINFLELHTGWQFFHTKMRKDGRITIPKRTLMLVGNKENLAGSAVQAIIEPA